MKTSQTPKLDVETLEYVIAMMNDKKALYEHQYARYENDDEIMADLCWGKRQAMKYAVRDLEKLIREQQAEVEE